MAASTIVSILLKTCLKALHVVSALEVEHIKLEDYIILSLLLPVSSMCKGTFCRLVHQQKYVLAAGRCLVVTSISYEVFRHIYSVR